MEPRVRRKKSGADKPANQRERIVETAIKIISQKGYAGTSIQEIADYVGIHKTTVFHYFKNKEEILRACLGSPIPELIRGLDEVIEDTSLGASEKLYRAILNHVVVLTRKLGVFDIYNSDLKALAPKARKNYLGERKTYEARVVFLVEMLQRDPAGLFRGLDSKMVAYGLLGMCNWVGKWYRSNGRLTPEQIAENFCGMLTAEFNRSGAEGTRWNGDSEPSEGLAP